MREPPSRRNASRAVVGMVWVMFRRWIVETCLLYLERLQQIAVDVSGHIQILSILITRDGIACALTGITINSAVIVSKTGQTRLDPTHKRSIIVIAVIGVSRSDIKRIIKSVNQQPSALIPDIVVIVPIMPAAMAPVIVCIS